MTKAQNAERAHLAAKSTVRGSGSSDRKRGCEAERREGTDDTVYPEQEEKKKTREK